MTTPTLNSIDLKHADPQEQILQLKRLLVTLKQQSEKATGELKSQLEDERQIKEALVKEVECLKAEKAHLLSMHEEEMAALREQLTSLREMYKQALDKVKQQPAAPAPDPDFIASQNSSYHLRQELESIKTTLLQNSKDANTLESRYAELFEQKIALDQQIRALNHQLEHQSSNLSAFQEEIREKESARRTLENTNVALEKELKEYKDRLQHIEGDLANIHHIVQERDQLLEKYEQMKDEWLGLSGRLDEALDGRIKAENDAASLSQQLQDWQSRMGQTEESLAGFTHDKETLELALQEAHKQLEESESSLRMAQQHLAKKVKEAAVLAEKLEEEQVALQESLQSLEGYKGQVSHLQASIELYQRQEKRLQEQLNEAYKGSEGQAAKWEEKYFQMYDKWQESESRVRDLRKFEEKHHQMQMFFSNLGSFMGNNMPSPSNLFQTIQEKPSTSESGYDGSEERIDLFGMRQPNNRPPATYHE